VTQASNGFAGTIEVLLNVVLRTKDVALPFIKLFLYTIKKSSSFSNVPEGIYDVK